MSKFHREADNEADLSRVSPSLERIKDRGLKTQKAVIPSNKNLSFNAALLTLTKTINDSHETYLFIIHSDEGL